MAEVDRKIDDGLPYAGGFQYSIYVPNAGTPLTPDGLRQRTGAAPARLGPSAGGSTNCGGASLF